MSAAVPIAASADNKIELPVFQANQFVDSIGVNTHLSSEPYLSRFDLVKRVVAELGIRHLRDELRPSNDISRWQELYRLFGVRSQMLVSPSTNTVTEMMAYISKLGREKLSAIEGQNEGDADWFMAHKAAQGNWSRTVVAYQREVFEALRRRYGSDLPVVSPSVINWKPNDVLLLRDAAPYSDHVAIHSYPQHAEEPETTADFAAVSWYLKHMRDNFKPGAPVMATETGYNTSTKPGGSGVSEKAASIYLPRMLIDHFTKGVERTFLYQLLDGGDDPANWEHHFGLIRHDDTPKPSFTAISNLIRALRTSDRDEPQQGPALQFEIRNATAKTRAVFLSHADGSATVVLWLAVSCWDQAKAEDLEVAPIEVTLSTPTSLKAARILIPNDSSDWRAVDVRAGKDLTVSVGAKIVLLNVTRQA